jgi:hypothetical protein
LGVVSTDEVIDGFTQLFNIDKAGSPERLAAQNAKPAFNLVKPGSVGRRKVEMHVGMALEPAVVLGFVGIEVVEDDVNLFFLFFLSVGFDDAVHEIQELPASPTFVMTGIDQSSGGFERREQRRRAMPFIFVSKARNGSTVG